MSPSIAPGILCFFEESPDIAIHPHGLGCLRDAAALQCAAEVWRAVHGVFGSSALGKMVKWAVDKNWMVGNLGIEACLMKFSWSGQQNYRVNMYSVKSNRMRQSWPVKVGFVHNRNVA